MKIANVEPRVFETKDSSRISKLEFYPQRVFGKIRIGYLIATFKTRNTRYKYYNVPEPLYNSIISAESVGKAFQEIVNDKDIKYEKLED